MEKRLISMGFLKGGIVEAIISTYSLERVPDAAPMGATLLDHGKVLIRPYVSTVTFTNLKAKGCAVSNLTSDPFLFLRTALKEVNPRVLPPEWFEEAKVVDAPRLKGLEAFVEVTVLESRLEEGKRADVICEAQLIEAFTVPAKAYCRASAALIEAAIHATRVKEFTRLGLHDLARDRRELMNASLSVVERVAAKSEYATAAARLISLVELWLREASQQKRVP
ncbi:MAG: DUF447 family protein [Candidatus Bathyarchaeia archaeon]